MIETNAHIVIVSSEFPPQPGGIGNHAYHLAQHLYEHGYEVCVITDERSKLGEEERAFDGRLPFRVDRIKSKSWRFLMYLRRIATTFKAVRHAPYVIATGKFSLWNVALCSVFCKCKILAVIHGSEVNFKSVLLRKSVDMALKRFDAIVAVSRFTKQLVSHLKRDVIVIPNGIDLRRWAVEEDPEISLKGTPVLTTVGRISERKGQMHVIKHLPELLKVYPDLHYHCVGISTEMPAFKSVAEDLGVVSHVTFHGVLDEARLKQVLAGTDLFVMLSTATERGDVEGFGIAILEANAMGVPAIGAKGAGVEDAIADGRSGVLIDGNDAQAFVRAVSMILEKKGAFKKQAYEWAEEHQWRALVQRYVGVIEGGDASLRSE
ncbi:glycosyltransferase family 4 protein [Aestuariivivens insulae]|uniref:glycosyltransferase family 4 protein n=1 Tax=Aestuariivivens insulae TaxID=1621988 RepID=UPI001F5AFF63|nr:glycosyltransferase family 4 protein [Aestuariivivens insulae]